MNRMRELVRGVALSVCLLVICSSAVHPQAVPRGMNDDIPAPSKEEFEESSQLLAPWLDTSCREYQQAVDDLIIYSIKVENLPGCTSIREIARKRDQTHVLTLYNEDGSLWYQFSLEQTSVNPKPYWIDTKEGFAPLYTGSLTVSSVILRLAGESRNWYQVEVNEKTRETKYALKRDTNWTKTRWDFWLYKSNPLLLKDDQLVLYDKPNGVKKVNIQIKWSQFLAARGDWAYVFNNNPNSQQKYFGWIRWRKGREFLVGCIFNYYFGLYKQKEIIRTSEVKH